MSETTFEEAKKCPKCGLPGEDSSTQPVVSRDLKMGRAAAHTIYCRNDKCSWLNTAWIVQVNPDGTVPVADYSKTQPKQFPMPVIDEVERRVVDAVERQLAQETKSGGGEIRRR
jgi:hypothetical protein